MEMEELWGGCKKELEKRFGVPNFASYLEPTNPIEYNNDLLSVMVPSSFVADWLEKNYHMEIIDYLSKTTGKKHKVKFVINPVKPKRVIAKASPVMAKKRTAAPLSHFKAHYSFKTFVVGKSNEFAHASALSCAKNPGEKYNPLFLYGGVGLGKTHLMQAIGKFVIEKNPQAQVLYLSSEQFVNQMISAIQKGQMDSFRKKFRNLDMLLVDDIQFIAGKGRTMEEFFHTFNDLFEQGKQIVVSSDQFPKDIKQLEERLKSRFQSGLIGDIQPADLETKIAIIKKKASLNKYKIPNDVAEYLAGAIRSNIRELEGCLARVVAFSSLTKRPIDIELAKETLDGVYNDVWNNISIAEIQKAVTNHFDLKPNDLKSKTRARKIALPRQIAMFLSREFTDESLPQIGKVFGGRDHSTVIHACKKITEEVEVNTRIYNDLSAIKRSLGL